MNLKDLANQYEPATTKNVSELGEVNINEEIVDETFKDNEGKDFICHIIKRGKEKYRVPNSVLMQLKMILEKKPDLKKFSVGKTGQGLNTQYTVIPL